ncbi:hypothetical protein jhhlp_006864 [Lomentospora prolificans]|uniref:Nephrocystin 3-like N-terminal domain-containing protein n=1 Tax=Lomentospora prolificans TaxID=41688 RepID=A0A2N3N2Y4_9PEZI|nr:hypothetical protein jhhlp_006864 [Lomentospora prolificans]
MVDVCFIHGLTGDRDNIWTAKGQSRPWFETLLPPALPKARIPTYGLRRVCGCLRLLASPQMESHSHDVESALTGTCRWLLKHEMYKRWADRDRALLWTKGKPGSGKSTSLKYALDNWQLTRMISFSLFLLPRSWRRAPAISTRSLETFGKRRREIGEHGEKVDTGIGKRLGTCSRNVFQRCSRPARSGCSSMHSTMAVKITQYTWHKSFKSLLGGANMSVGSCCHICFTCRPCPILRAYCELEICLEHENKEDISTYVDTELSDFSGPVPNIPNLITERANGVFMWARLVVDQAIAFEYEGRTMQQIKEKIYSVSPDLKKLYQDLVRNMGPTSLKLVQWICFAQRPLALGELRRAMVIDANRPYKSLEECRTSPDCESENSRMERQARTFESWSCRDHHIAISLSGSEDLRPSLSSSYTYTSLLKDFFIDVGLLALDRTLESIDAAIGLVHNRRLRICLRYLATEEVGTLASRHLLLPPCACAATSWVTHMRECDARSAIHDDLLELFF